MPSREISVQRPRPHARLDPEADKSCQQNRAASKRGKSREENPNAPSLHLTCTASRVKTPPRSGVDTHRKSRPRPPGVLGKTHEKACGTIQLATSRRRKTLFRAQRKSNYLMARRSQMCALLLSLESDGQPSESQVTEACAITMQKKKPHPHTLRKHTGTHHDTDHWHQQCKCQS